MTANRYKASFWGDGNSLDLGSGDGFTTLNYTNNDICILKW